MAASATSSRERVRTLNDQLRQHRIGGTVVVTPGVAALAPNAISATLAAVAGFELPTLKTTLMASTTARS
jgi:hypothetical protein